MQSDFCVLVGQFIIGVDFMKRMIFRGLCNSKNVHYLLVDYFILHYIGPNIRITIQLQSNRLGSQLFFLYDIKICFLVLYFPLYPNPSKSYVNLKLSSKMSSWLLSCQGLSDWTVNKKKKKCSGSQISLPD